MWLVGCDRVEFGVAEIWGVFGGKVLGGWKGFGGFGFLWILVGFGDFGFWRCRYLRPRGSFAATRYWW